MSNGMYCKSTSNVYDNFPARELPRISQLVHFSGSWGIRLSKVVSFILIVTIIFGSVVIANATTQDEARTELARAFTGVQSAERAGYNVAELAKELNNAASLLDSGGENNVAQALALIQNVSASTPVVPPNWIQAQTDRLVMRIAIVLVLGAAAFLVWFYGSNVYWWFWRRTLRGWRVERI